MTDITKYCTRCSESKPLAAFYKRRKTNKPSSYCKECHKAQALERQRAIKAKCVAYKGGACARCGYNKCFSAMEFHHTDPQEKDFSISSMKTTTFSDKHKKELNKCILVCCRCHRELHAEIHSSKTWVEKIRTPDELSVTKQKRIEKKRKPRSAAKRPTKIEWPPTAILIEMVTPTNYCVVARELGVTDNAVRKRIKNHPVIQ